MQHIYLLSFILVTLLISSHTAATAQVGFVEGLWFSTDTYIERTPIRIYAAIRNHSNSDITGTVSFYVNDQRIKQQTVSALNNRIIEAWADWSPDVGTHSIRATFSEVSFESIASSSRPLDTSTTLERTITVIPAPPPSDPMQPESVSGLATTTQPREGLETYLAPSRARTLLTHITNWSSSTKHALEARQERAGTSTHLVASSTPTEEAHATSGTTTNKPGSMSYLSDLLSVANRVVMGIYKVLLNVGIVLFTRPVLVQLILLIGILYGVYRTAQYFGRRS